MSSLLGWVNFIKLIIAGTVAFDQLLNLYFQKPLGISMLILFSTRWVIWDETIDTQTNWWSSTGFLHLSFMFGSWFYSFLSI